MLQHPTRAAMTPPFWPRNVPPETTEYGDADRDDGRPVVHVYQPCRSAMQPGRAKRHDWVLEFDSADPQSIEPLMGWTSSRDMRRPIQMRFPSLDSAAAFAQRRGWRMLMRAPQQRRMRPKSYADRFRAAFS